MAEHHLGRQGAIGLALFGSRARGDHSANSDIDLLLWTASGRPGHIRRGSVSISLYSRDDLLEKAARGDLFVGHLVTEAAALWDPLSLLAELRSAFEPRTFYDDVIQQAEDIGHYVLFNAAMIEPFLLNRRIAWVARTILIARAIERGHLSFSPRFLTGFAELPAASCLIDGKDDVAFNSDRLLVFERFLERWGTGQAPREVASGYEQLFRRTANSFGLKTVYEAAEATSSGLYA